MTWNSLRNSPYTCPDNVSITNTLPQHTGLTSLMLILWNPLPAKVSLHSNLKATNPPSQNRVQLFRPSRDPHNPSPLMAQLHSRDEARRRWLVCHVKVSQAYLTLRSHLCRAKTNPKQRAKVRGNPNLAFLNRLLDLLDLDFAETLDLQKRLTRRGMDGLDYCRDPRLAIRTQCQLPAN